MDNDVSTPGGSPTATTRLLWALTLVLAGVAAVLGYVGFDGYVRGQGAFATSDPADLVYYTVQLFLVDPTPLGAGDVNLPLQIARFLAPLTTLLALVQTLALLFGDWFQSLWRRRFDHVVVIGGSPAAALLAENLVTAGKRVITIGTAVFPRSGAKRPLHISGDPLDRSTLRAAGVARASGVYAVDDEWAVNAGVALAVSSDATSSTRIYAYIEDEVLIRALRDQLDVDSLGPVPQFVSLDTIAALELLDVHPPGYDAAGRPVPTVIAGSGRFALALLQELGRAAHHAGDRREVTVVTRQPHVLAERRRGLRWQDNLTVAVEEQMPTVPDAAVVYVCWADPDEMLRTTLTYRPSGTGKVVLCLTRLAGLGRALNSQRVLDAERVGVFGVLDVACDHGRIAGALTEQLARALHANYRRNRILKGENRPSAVPWEQLEPRYRTSSREQAADIGRKIAVIGAELKPAGVGIPDLPVSDQQLEQLAMLEHERWVIERTRAGETGHADLKPWSDLDDATKAKDIESIRALPEALAEAGWQIV